VGWEVGGGIVESLWEERGREQDKAREEEEDALWQCTLAACQQQTRLLYCIALLHYRVQCSELALWYLASPEAGAGAQPNE